jgi:methylmalonyl-CoA mutase N-terminal domain/subunit
VPISTLEDMETLLEGLPLGEITTSMTINATAAILLAFYVAVADERGVPRDRLGGTVQNDILKEYIARGTYIYPTDASMRLVTDIFDFCSSELPR